MKKSTIQQIVEEAKLHGHDVRIRDIAYALLKHRFDDSLIPYSVVFGQPEKDTDIAAYDALPSVKYLVKMFDKENDVPKENPIDEGQAVLDMIFKSREAKKSSQNDITFEENKAAIVELVERTEQALAEKTIKTDVGLKIIADLRVKLNDKFGAAEKSEDETIVVVPPKNNHICQHTRKECWLQTKEYAMEHWHLIPDPKYKK